MAFTHGDSLAERWPTFTFAFQMANVGTDVSRALMARGVNTQKSTAALERALELLSLTIQHARPAIRLELCRVREALAASYVEAESPIADLQTLDRYFQPFALLAATERQPVAST